ncbi:MAG: DUF3536 domain-containing protein, partial [Anaerolineae bacterium]|nr:DUF3536 domain-containing protein [Anaerolineae bacterium]
MERYVCIHGHFYQPPRENPWLEAVEAQDSAYPYHDWNERITAECYAANATARILTHEQRVERITNNYARINFNFGPTLMAWLETKQPDVYQAILQADVESQTLFSGHGSAIAQAYNHLIMPLANHRDKVTQVVWGIRDFEHRFGRKPRGLWLPETAVDLETLEVLAENDIDFTILAPYQAHRIRKIGDDEWTDVLGGHIDPTRAYVQRLPSGRSINLLFYDGPISRAIAFEEILSSGENFAHRLASAFRDGREWSQMVHIATDGETYGHHHRRGEMALAYALDYIQRNEIAQLTNYTEFLEKNPPTHEVEIVENTAWSCAHGIGRWHTDCGCNSGGYPDWNQAWREPLRDALDWLRDEVTPHYERAAAAFLRDPWAARDQYVDVIIDRSPDSLKAFFAECARGKLDDTKRRKALELLEMQRHLLLMYTSCGWFFDELSGIETVQVIQYAGRVVQLAQSLIPDLEERFLCELEKARSNMPEHGDGRQIYTKWVKPAIINLETVVAHYAMSEIFEQYPDSTSIYCYDVEREDYTRVKTGISQLVAGRVNITSHITGEFQALNFASLYIDNHNLTGGVSASPKDEASDKFQADLVEAFKSADRAATIRVMSEYFEDRLYSLNRLFRDEQRKILGIIMQTINEEAENIYRQFYRHNASLMSYLSGLNLPLPPTLSSAAEFTINANLRRALLDDEVNLSFIHTLLDEGNALGVHLDSGGLAFQLVGRLSTVARNFRENPTDPGLLQQFEVLAELVRD